MDALGSKNTHWASKTSCPADWLSTLSCGRNGQSVALEFRFGRRGGWLIHRVVALQMIEGVPISESLMPLATELWEMALLHRGTDVADSKRVDYRIRIVESSDDGEESEYVSDPIGLDEKDGELSMLDDDGGGQSKVEHLLWQIANKLFTHNITMARANAEMAQRMASAGDERWEREQKVLDYMRSAMAEQLERERSIMQEEADAQEVKELGALARKWMGLAHEAKLADKGVATPPLPKSRKSAAKTLRASITLGQMEAFRSELGEEMCARLFGLFAEADEGASDEEISAMFGQLAGGDIMQLLRLKEIADGVFSTKYVPSTWAIYQSQCLRILLEGPDDAGDAEPN